MSRETLNNQPPAVDIDKLEDTLSFIRAGLDEDDAETLANNLSPEEREAAKYVYRCKPPVTPPAADSEMRRLNNTYRDAIGITSIDLQTNSIDPLANRPRN